MRIESFTVGPFAENSWLLIDGDRAVLIDPGFSTQPEFSAFRKTLQESGATLQAVLLTHAHLDHVLGLNQVLRFAQVPVHLNHSDLTFWKSIEQQAAMFGVSASGFSFIPEPLPEQSGFRIGPFLFDVLYTPGHSPDHVSLSLPDHQVLIAGDLLFRESIGRTDLYKGDFDLLERSIREKLYTLPDETLVCPGHGPTTTIGHEKANNPFVPA